MKPINRRDALGQTCVASLGSRLAVEQGIGAEVNEDKAPPKRELFVIGPVSLGKLYKSPGKGEPIGDSIETNAGPPAADIVKAFNECRVYVIDHRVREGTNKWQFATSKDGFPKVAVEGKLFHTLKERKGKPFTIQIVELFCRGTQTVVTTTQTPTRSLRVGVRLKIQGSRRILSVEADYNLLPERRIEYDKSGKQR
jgi:hypothetical protein